MKKYDVKVFRKIDEVGSSKWNKLAEMCFLKTDFLEIVEGLELCSEPYYTCVYFDNKLVGIAVFYGQLKSFYSNFGEILYGKYNRFVKGVLGLNPALLCYMPYAPFYEMFAIDKSLNVFEREEIFRDICEMLEELSVRDGYVSYGFLGVENEDFVNLSSDILFSFFAGFKMRVEIAGKNYEEQILSYKGSHRRTVRKDLRRFEGSEYDTEVIKKLGKDKKNILKILDENLEKYEGNKNGESLIAKEFLEALDKKSDGVTYFLGRMKNKITSVLVAIEDDLRLVGLRVGQVASTSGEGFPFYKVAIHEPISYASENSKKYFELGTGNYRYKTRRGATIYDSYILLNVNSRMKRLYLRKVVSLLSARNRKKHLSRIDVV